MTGSLQTKNDRYYMVLNLAENGKRKQKWIATNLPAKGNKRKAEQMLRETITEYERTPQKVKETMLFADCIRLWLEIAKRKVDTVTYQGYELMSNAQIIPYFEETRLRLCDISTDTLQMFFDVKSTRGRKDGKGGLSPSSLRQYRNIINQTINFAVKTGIILFNPCQFVELPHKEHFEASFYTAEQLRRLFETAKGDSLYPLIKITALYGLRRSEVLGLKWDSVDFEANRITIRRTVSKVTKAVEKNKTKNSSSHRSFPLTPEARRIFLEVKADEEESRRLFGNSFVQNDYVFKWPNGALFSPDYVSHHFSLILKKGGLPHIRFHELRHSCASLLLSNGFTLKDVQEYLGHADIQMTANIYGHLDTARKRELTENIAGSIFAAC